MWLGLGFIVALVAALPCLLNRRFILAGTLFVIEGLLLSLVFWSVTPGMVGPLGGAYGVMMIILMVINAVASIIAGIETDDGHDKWLPGAGLASVALGILLVTAMTGWSAFRWVDYRDLIGPVETKHWTLGFQPKSPGHVRIVSPECADQLARKSLGGTTLGAIGNQVQIDESNMSPQIIRGEQRYVGALDFRGFWEWMAAKKSPGFVTISAENPDGEPYRNFDEGMVYTPGASFGHKLYRYLREHGYLATGLAGHAYEVDENLKGWYVVTTYHPTIAWGGEKIDGVLIVDPVSGEIHPYRLGEVPNWVDLVVPQEFVKMYADNWGKFQDGWWSSWLGKSTKLVEPEEPTNNFGADSEPYWVCGMTSRNSADQSLMGYMFFDARSGKAVYYAMDSMKGGTTESGLMEVVNNGVKFMNLHAGLPAVYNIYGSISGVCQLLGESHTHQGVAIINVNDVSMWVWDKTEAGAFRKYQAALEKTGQTLSPEATKDVETVTGIVRRFSREYDGTATCYILLEKGARGFLADMTISSELHFAKEGDRVTMTYVASDESVQPVRTFDDLEFIIQPSKGEAALAARTAAQKQAADEHLEDASAAGQMKDATPEQLKAFREFQKAQKARPTKK